MDNTPLHSLPCVCSRWVCHSNVVLPRVGENVLPTTWIKSNIAHTFSWHCYLLSGERGLVGVWAVALGDGKIIHPWRIHFEETILTDPCHRGTTIWTLFASGNKEEGTGLMVLKVRFTLYPDGRKSLHCLVVGSTSVSWPLNAWLGYSVNWTILRLS